MGLFCNVISKLYVACTTIGGLYFNSTLPFHNHKRRILQFFFFYPYENSRFNILTEELLKNNMNFHMMRFIMMFSAVMYFLGEKHVS